MNDAQRVAEQRWRETGPDHAEARWQAALVGAYIAMAAFCIGAAAEHVRRLRRALR